MGHPSHSDTYEQTHHLLFQLASRETIETRDLPFESEKAAHKFRLRHYSYMKCLSREIKEEASLPMYKTPLVQIQERLESIRLARRLKLSLLLDPPRLQISNRDNDSLELANLLTEVLLESSVEEAPQVAITDLYAAPKEKTFDEDTYIPNPMDEMEDVGKANTPHPASSVDKVVQLVTQHLLHEDSFSQTFDSEEACQTFQELLPESLTAIRKGKVLEISKTSS